MTLPIEDYGIIGDLHTAALVGRDGSIDWLCLPRFDSAACFAKLLGNDDHGFWKIAPKGSHGATHRHYRGDTLVLESEFVTDEGTVRVIDCMPIRQQHPEVVRLVEGVRGKVTMEMNLTIRFGYGQIVPWVRQARRHAQRHRRPGRALPLDADRVPGPGPLDRGRVHGVRGPADPVLADLVPGQRGAAPAGGRGLRHPGHRAVVDRLVVAVHLPGRLPRGGGPLADHAEGPHLRADRRHRGRGHHLAAGDPRAAAATGTTGSAGCATPPSPSSR